MPKVLSGNGLDYLKRVRAAAQRMSRQLEALLGLSRIGQAALRPAAVDLATLADSVAAELRQFHAARQVDFVRADHLPAYGDPTLVRVLLENLLGNAWKFTARREAARVELGLEPAGEAAAFFVRDNGAGFDMAYSQRLFGAFQRLHDQAEFAGDGIGLATAQRIVNRHGGRVWAEAQVGAGATFYFTR